MKAPGRTMSCHVTWSIDVVTCEEVTRDRTSSAALSPACIAPLMKPRHRDAVSVPAKCILHTKRKCFIVHNYI